jgi:hypothetical protein
VRNVYRVTAQLIAFAVVVQAAVIAFGLFGIWNDVDDGRVVTDGYDGNGGFAIHSILGSAVIPLLALLLLVVSFFVKVDGAVKWAGLVVLAVAVQITLAFIAFGVPAVGLLHAANAFIIAGVASMAARRAGSGSDEKAAPAPAASL